MANRLDQVWELYSNKEFQKQWEGLYDQTMKYVRIHCVDLFGDNDWQDLLRYQYNGHNDGVKSELASYLLSAVVKHFDEKIARCNNSLIPDMMTYTVTRDDLKKTYENDPFKFIETLARCLKEEEFLIEKYTKPSEEEREQANITASLKLLSQSEQMEESVKKHVTQLRNYIESDKQNSAGQQNKEDEKQALKSNNHHTRRRNGIDPKMALEKVEADLRTLADDHVRIQRGMDTSKQQITETLSKFLMTGKDLQVIFNEVIAKWKQQHKLRYVYLMEHEYSLKGMEERYKKYGKMLYNLLHFLSADLQELSGAFWDMERDIELQSSINNLHQLFEELCQSSFLVTDQVRHLIKVELGSKKRTKDLAEEDDTKPGQKFKCPKFNAVVRLLATEGIEGRQKVKAYFCHQQTLNELNNNNKWEELESLSFPLNEKGCWSGFGQQGLASFRNLELLSFKRDTDKHVCEEKYRIVFVTEQMVAGRLIRLQTLSLPMVITTGASQGSNAHGSLLWQCFSVDDVMKYPLESPSVLPWSTVAEMLNSKFKTLGGRDLRSDELQHLASRVSGIPISNLNKDTEIQFRKFCLDKMMDVKESKDAKNKSATFWMWILSVFNLTKFYLQEYWQEGFIDGFSAKEDSDKKLKMCLPFKAYTFLLRFSDHVITDGQGQNMCGAISTAFVYKTEDGSIKTGNARPFKAENFKDKSLAQLIKAVHVKDDAGELPLQWLYPGNKSRDDAFQPFYQSRGRIRNPDQYDEIEERLLIKLGKVSIQDGQQPKEEPIEEVPVGKKSKQNSDRQQASLPASQPMALPSYTDSNIQELYNRLEKMDQPSPTSTIFNGDVRNSGESGPLSDVQSPASSFIMSPQNGMSVCSPQSSHDEVFSPDCIPVTVFDKMGQTNTAVNGNHGNNPAVNNDYNRNQTEQMTDRSFSLPEQHPTLANLLTNTSSREELRAKLLSKSHQPTGQIATGPMVQQEFVNVLQGDGQQMMSVPLLDLNSLQAEFNGNNLTDIDMLESTQNLQYPFNDVMLGVHNQNVEISDNFEHQVEIIPENIQLQMQQALGSNPNNLSLQEQLNQMVSDPAMAQQFSQLLSIMNQLTCTSQHSNIL